MSKFEVFLTKYRISACGLAKLCGMSKSMVCEYRRGLHKPSLRSAQRIARALRLPLDSVTAQIDVREQSENRTKPAVYCVTCHRQFYRVPSNRELYDGGEVAGNQTKAA